MNVLTFYYFFQCKNGFRTMRLLAAASLLWSVWAEKEETKSSPPSFFLIDTSDQLCLAGETFKRCSIDTLFYVVGSPGMYF